VKTYYIIDGPQETIQDSLYTLKKAWELKPDTCHFMPFVPIPNTKGAEIFKQLSPAKYERISNIIDLKMPNIFMFFLVLLLDICPFHISLL
jgi:biotin synthase-like enzyme